MRAKNWIYICAMVLGVLLLNGCSASRHLTEQEQAFGTQAATKRDTKQQKTVRIAIVDSGISTRAIPKEYIDVGKNYVDEAYTTEDTYGHGTAVASIIYQEVQDCEVIFVPLVTSVYEDRRLRSADGEALAKAVCDAVDVFACDVINISAGIEQDNPSLKEAVAYAKEKKVAIVAAVGNDYETAPGKRYYPAAYESVIAVGASDKTGERADFSQDWADVYVEGVDVPIYLMSGNTDTGSATSYAAARYTAQLATNYVKDGE